MGDGLADGSGAVTALGAALAAVQAELPVVRKTKTADVKGVTRQGERYTYSYSYADYADVAAAVLPLLGKNGLAFVALPTLTDSGRFGLVYRLLHSSGEAIGGFYPIDDSLPPQQVGGLITYARRYCLSAVTGVASEEDTDAQGAQHGHQGGQAGRERIPAAEHRAAASGPEKAAEDRDVAPGVQELADLAFLLVRQRRPVAELQEHVYDAARAHRGWLTSRAVHPLERTFEPLSAIIRDAKARLEAQLPVPAELPVAPAAGSPEAADE
jgi:hypothetical protein